MQKILLKQSISSVCHRSSSFSSLIHKIYFIVKYRFITRFTIIQSYHSAHNNKDHEYPPQGSLSHNVSVTHC